MLTSQRKLIAGTVLVAVLSAAGAAFAAIKLDHTTTNARTVAAVAEPGIGGFGLGGRLGGRGLGGGLGQGGGPRTFRRGGGPGFGFGAGGFGLLGQGLTAVSSYLGLDASTLRSDLEKGQTLAQIAKAQGKTADGLVSAIVAAEEKALESSVSAGRLTKAQEQQLESRLTQTVTALVNGARPAAGRGLFGGGLPQPGQAPSSGATA